MLDETKPLHSSTASHLAHPFATASESALPFAIFEGRVSRTNASGNLACVSLGGCPSFAPFAKDGIPDCRAMWFCLRRANQQLCRRPLIDLHRAFLIGA